ncbi:MAG TPA: hypothetical protein ENN60_04005 [archaeon]|nr:hypothetical protein [archaeon]
MAKEYTPEEFPVRCEVFSRVVGYIRPVAQWNDGKQEEFRQRKTFETTPNGVLLQTVPPLQQKTS